MPDSTLSAGAIEAVAQLAVSAAGKTVEIDGVAYATAPLHDPRQPAPAPDVLEMHSLTALVRYIAENRDGLSFERCAVHVESPTSVSLVGPLSDGHYRQRFAYARATARPAADGGFHFGAFLDLERFNIALQALFTGAGQRDDVIRFVGNIKSEQVRQQSDDGKTQSVEARTGIATVATVDVPNPVTLAPYRTFMEIPQVASPFVLRLREESSGIVAALFEADGGAWKEWTIGLIGKFLEDRLSQLRPAPCVFAAPHGDRTEDRAE
ncbi:hypothetical protein [Candidatus Palauibacter sp.]|uniref:hypothetical protein n=1 Tax=Candidatus Palauibacter sp. TaxID=3101350 RepID=UPI003CC6A45F